MALRAGSDLCHGCAADWKELNPTHHDFSRVWALSTLEQPGPVAGLRFSILSPGLEKQDQVTETGGGCWHPGCSLGPCAWTNALEGTRAPRADGAQHILSSRMANLCAPLRLTSRCELCKLPLCSAEWQCGLCCPPGWVKGLKFAEKHAASGTAGLAPHKVNTWMKTNKILEYEAEAKECLHLFPSSDYFVNLKDCMGDLTPFFLYRSNTCHRRHPS